MNSITNLMSIAYLINDSTHTSYDTEITPLKEEVPCTFSYNENSDDPVEKEIAPTFSSSVRKNEATLSYQAQTNFTQFAINSHQIQNNSNDTQMNSEVEIDSDEETAHSSTSSKDQVIHFNQEKETSKGILKGKWSGEENRKLADLVAKFGGNPETFNMKTWDKIANGMQSRTTKQIKYHWRQHVNPNIKRFQWSEEEDKILKQQMKIHPGQWKRIAQSIPGRTSKQVQMHYEDVLVNKRVTSWTAQEDNILKNGFELFGRQWRNIAHLINEKINTDGTIRTANQCCQRWDTFKKM